MRPLNSKELKELRATLAEQYGFTSEFPYTVFESGEDKYYLVNRDVEYLLDKKLRIERFGIYFAQLAHGELRFSIEGSQLIGPGATKRIIEINSHQRDEWMLGKDVELSGEYEQAFHIVRHGTDYMGCGKFKNGTLQNYVPKERYVSASFPEKEVQ